MSTLITGATGFIGRHLTSRLIQAGESVRVLTRDRGKLPPEWANSVQVITGNLLDLEVQKEATQGISTVFNLAGEIKNPELMKAVNASAVEGLLDSAVAAGVNQFVHLSSVGVVGADEPGVITEDTACRPQNEYEQTKLEGEQAVAKAANAGVIKAVIARPTIVFGEGNTNDSVLGWLRAVRQSRFFFVGRKGIANYVYVGDVVEAILKVSQGQAKQLEVFNIADPAPLREFVAAMAEALQVPVPKKSIPVPLAFSVGAAFEAANRLAHTPAPLTRARVRALSSQTLFSGEKLKERGFVLPFGYREGLARTVKWYQQTGRL